jgi:branched-chain amino acid transport system substrate-binding protein
MRLKHAVVGLVVVALGASAVAAVAGTGGKSGTRLDAAKPPVRFSLISYSIPGADSLTELGDGAKAAQKALNAKGGFGGRKIIIDTCNSQLQPAAATACAHKLLANHPTAEFGCELAWSHSGLLLYAKAHVPSVNCLNDPIDYHNPWSFGIVGGTTGQNHAMANYLCTRKDIKKVTSLFPDLPDYHAVVYPIMVKTFKACGKQSAVAYYPLTAVDPTPYVNKVVTGKPDFVNFTGIGGQAVAFFKTFQQNGIKPSQIATTDVDFTGKLVKQGGSAMDGMYMENQFTPWGYTQDPEVAQYVKDAKAAGVDYQSPSVEWGYAYVMFLYTAAKAIGFDKFTGDTLKKWMDTTNGVHIPLSRTIVNPGPKGYPQIKQPYQRIARWMGGKFVILKTGPKKDGWTIGF